MSLPRVKRQFVAEDANPSQRRITSYFDKVPQDGRHSAAGSTTAPTTASFPDLPPSVQSNLLNAAMRVRKSVTEGRKSVGSWGWNPNDEQVGGSGRATSYASSLYPMGAAPRELEPFSGIHRIGGYMAQPVAARHGWEDWNACVNNMDVGDLNTSGIESLPSSQESVVSTQGSARSAVTAVLPRLKRFRDDSDDEDGTDDNHSAPAAAVSCLPRLVPRPRRGRRRGADPSRAVAAFQDFDATEASFLDPSNLQSLADEMEE